MILTEKTNAGRSKKHSLRALITDNLDDTCRQD